MEKSNEDFKIVNAEVAQLVERQPSKLNVASSTLVFRSWKIKRRFKNRKRGSSSVGRASAFQAECREFDPRLPLNSTKILIDFDKDFFIEIDFLSSNG